MDGRSQRCGQVDARVDVATRAERVVRLELKARAAERLADGRPHDDARKRKAHVARNLRRDDDPNHRRAGDHRDHAQGGDHAFASACSRWRIAPSTLDCILCAAFSAPPRAPGTLNTIRREARAKRWWTTLPPLRSSANPMVSTNSWAGCMKRLVVK